MQANILKNTGIFLENTEEYWNISGKALHCIPIFYQIQYKASATYQFINYSTTSYHPSLEQKLQLPEQ